MEAGGKGAAGRDLRAEFAVGEVAIRGNINNVNGAIMMSVVPKANNSKDITRMTQTLTQWADEGASGRIGFRFVGRMSPTAARLSSARAAYLAAFAALGWRYVFLACLNPLRAQLAAPAQSILPPIEFFDPAAPRECRQLLVVQEPAEMRSLAVVLGRHTVFLPWATEPKSFNELTAALERYSALPASHRQCVRKRIPWPSEDEVGSRLAAAVRIMGDDGGVKAYGYLHGDGRNLIRHLGPSFGTKFLYFAGYDRASGDILSYPFQEPVQAPGGAGGDRGYRPG